MLRRIRQPRTEKPVSGQTVRLEGFLAVVPPGPSSRIGDPRKCSRHHSRASCRVLKVIGSMLRPGYDELIADAPQGQHSHRSAPLFANKLLRVEQLRLQAAPPPVAPLVVAAVVGTQEFWQNIACVSQLI